MLFKNLLLLKFIILLLINFGNTNSVYSQESGIPINSYSYHLLDRLAIKTQVELPFDLKYKAISRTDVITFLQNKDFFEEKMRLSEMDKVNIGYLIEDNNELFSPSKRFYSKNNRQSYLEKVYTDSSRIFYTLEEKPMEIDSFYLESFRRKKPILKFLYSTRANFLQVDKENFYLRLNPVLNLKAGFEKEEEKFILKNQRGISLRGGISNKVFFYSTILESQSRFPNYINKRISRDNSIPGQGFFKSYESTVLNIDNGYDYLNAQGYLGFKVIPAISIYLGHGNNFIGDGIRSLLLSDFSNNYFYLKINSKFWKFRYQNIFGELAGQSSRDRIGDNLLLKKYFASHHLSYNPSPQISIGFFESIVFSRNNNFELQYLNPMILYRAVEQSIGSPDNVLLGFDARFNFFKKAQIYGQIIIDDLRISEVLKGEKGYWSNKYGGQLGIKYIDILNIDHLDSQIEYNWARPYTYSHRDSSANYSHFNQALAHPLGANFREILLKLRYQPISKLVFTLNLVFSNVGEDEEGKNWGNNILLPSNTRINNYGNFLLQGTRNDIFLSNLNIQLELFHNGYLDLDILYRNKKSANILNNLQTTYFDIGFRMNFGNRIEFL